MIPRQQDAGRGRDHRSGQHVRRGVRHRSAEDGHIGHDRGAGDAGHAHGEQQKQIGARQRRQIAADEDRPLDLAHEHRRRHGQGRRAAQPHAALEHQPEAARQPLQDAPVPQQGGEGAYDDDDRQDAEREHEQTLGMADRIGLAVRRSGQEAEHELHARLGAGRQRIHRRRRAVQRQPRRRQREQDQDQDGLDHDDADRLAPGKRAALLRQRPAQADDRDDPRQALRILQSEHRHAPQSVPAHRSEMALRGKSRGRWS
jgi:hypothetical protein